MSETRALDPLLDRARAEVDRRTRLVLECAEELRLTSHEKYRTPLGVPWCGVNRLVEAAVGLHMAQAQLAALESAWVDTIKVGDAEAEP